MGDSLKYPYYLKMEKISVERIVHFLISKILPDVMRLEEVRNACRFLLENLEVTDHSEDLCVDARIILKSLLGKLVGGCGLDSSGSRWRALVKTLVIFRVP
jgi:hypothetical protein